MNGVAGGGVRKMSGGVCGPLSLSLSLFSLSLPPRHALSYDSSKKSLASFPDTPTDARTGQKNPTWPHADMFFFFMFPFWGQKRNKTNKTKSNARS